MPTIKQLCRTNLPALFTAANPAYTFVFDADEYPNNDHLSRHVTIRINAVHDDMHVASATINFDDKSWSVSMWPTHDRWLTTLRHDANDTNYSAKGSLDTFIGHDYREITDTEFTRITKQWLRRVLSNENISVLHANQLYANLNRDLQYARYERVTNALWLLGFARLEVYGYAYRAAVVDGKRTTIHMRPANQPAWTREPQASDLLPTANVYMTCEIKIEHLETKLTFIIELQAYTSDDMRIQQITLPLNLYADNHDLFRELEADMYALVSPIVAANKGE